MNSTESGTGSETLGHAMKIYFCDLCNESIPLKDINSNRITIEEGKIFCQKCAPKKLKSGDRVPGAVFAVVALLLIGLVLLAGYGWKVAADLDTSHRSLKSALASTHRGDREAYTDAKSDFIQSALRNQ